MNNDFPFRLKMLMDQLRISNAQLARGVNVDPSLISRWLRTGCGARKAADHASAIGQYVAKRRLSPENRAWLNATVGAPATAATIARWLCPESGMLESDEIREEVVESFHHAVEKRPDRRSRYSAVDGMDRISGMMHDELAVLPDGAVICIHLSSEGANAAVDPRILSELKDAVDQRKMTVQVLVESANNSRMSSRLISAYMPLLVQGQLTISIIQGTPQTFTVTTSLILGEQAAIIITETAQKHVTAVGTVIREGAAIRDMRDSFENSRVYARPMMIAYNDSFARNIVEVFFEEYGVAGSLDVIKSGLNPMYLTVEEYGRILREFQHPDDQYLWRYQEFDRFKAAMAEVLRTSRFREVLSLTKLREIAATGICRMPSMYFFEAGICHLDAQDCVNLLNGYIHYLETDPNFQVVLLEDEQLFMPNSCWHIKNNKHIMIHSWNIDEPMMVYSDQLMLIDEFQRHFEVLWERSLKDSSVKNSIRTLEELRDQCAEKIRE